jgi:hypothetical protein
VIDHTFQGSFSNPQSYLCAIIAGLLFAPTTIGDMVWGAAFFQQDRGVEYSRDVSLALMTPRLGLIVTIVAATGAIPMLVSAKT